MSTYSNIITVTPEESVDPLVLAAFAKCKKHAIETIATVYNEPGLFGGQVTLIGYSQADGTICEILTKLKGNPLGLTPGTSATYPLGDGSPGSGGGGAEPELVTGFDFVAANADGTPGATLAQISGIPPVSFNTFFNTIILYSDPAGSYQRLVGLLDDDTAATGTAQADHLDLGGGNDTFDAGAGDDRLYKWKSGNLTYNAGDGSDSLIFQPADGDVPTPPNGVVVDLVNGTGSNPYGGTLTLTNVENVSGVFGLNNDLRGNGSNNTLVGGIATDTLRGEGGDDAVTVGYHTTLAPRATLADGGPGTDTLTVTLSDASAAPFTGAGQSLIATNTLDLLDQAQNTGTFHGGTFSNFEIIRATGDNFQRLDFRGTDAGEMLVSGAGPDILTGRGGDDFLLGGNRDDAIEGGAGHDTAAWFASPERYVVRSFLQSGAIKTMVTDQAGSDGTDSLTGIEAVQFSTDIGTLAGQSFALAGAQLNNLSNVAGSRFDDVLIQNGVDGLVYYARMSNGAFQNWGVVTGAMGGDWKAVATGDVNPSAAQGAAETFVQQQSTGTIYYASLDTGATVWGVVSTSLTADWKLRAVADVNSDASADAIVQNQTNGTIYYANMLGGTFQNWGVVNANLTVDWVAAGAGDINGDGFADVIVQQQSTGTTYYANMAGGAFSGWGVVSTNLTSAWKAVAVADVTRDGIADVIFQNANANGLTYYADLKTGTVQWGVVASSITSDWGVQGVGDIDNDGRADVLFQNATNGTVYAAEVDGIVPSVPSWSAVTTNITNDWHVV